MSTVTESRRSDARRNHERIIAAALEVFAEKGAAASVPEVAERAGVGKATVYRNYPTKADLVAAVAVDRLQWVADRAAQAAAEPNAWPALQAYVDDVVTHVARDRALCDVLRNERTADAEALRARKRAALDELIGRGQEQGSIRPDVVEADLQIVLAGVADQLHRELETDVTVWRRYAALVLDAFRNRPLPE